MKNYRLLFTLAFSIALHLLILSLIFFNPQGLKFKKGVGENPKIKVSSFDFSSFDSQAKIPPSSSQKASPNQNQKSQLKKQVLQKTLQQKNPSKSQQSQDNQKNDQHKQDDSLLRTTEKLNPKIPIYETLSYQLASAQTKKDISQFYGAEFGQLGTQEQEYILNNLALIGRITQSYLHYPPNAGMLAQSGGNAVEFYLHPNGDISDLKIIKKSGFILLDRNSIKTIEIAYKDYPHPKSKTLIRFYINYYLIR